MTLPAHLPALRVEVGARRTRSLTLGPSEALSAGEQRAQGQGS